MIKAVAFDYGGVLTEGGKRGSISKMISEFFAIPQEQLELQDLINQLGTGQIDADRFVAMIAERHGVIIPKDTHKIWELVDVYAKSELVYELAEALKAQKIKTAIFSNVNEPIMLLLESGGFYDGFDELVLSAREGLIKPDIKFYRLLLKRLDAHGTEVIFVEDQEKNRPPAEELGMHFVLAKGPNQIVDDVKAIIKRENRVDMELGVA